MRLAKPHLDIGLFTNDLAPQRRFWSETAGLRLDGTNFRYLTVQIFDADAACAQIVARGGTLGRAPVTLGEVARYGFVCDADGNWTEISARASLTGIVPRPD